MQSVKFIIRIIRAPFLIASALPVINAAGLGYYTCSRFRIGDFFLCFFTVAFFHAGANVLNDYEDTRSGCDDFNRDYIAPFTGGSRVVQEGIVTQEYLKNLAIFLFLLGIISGLILSLRVDLRLLLFFPPAFIGAWLYTRFFSRLGIGELIILINFGILTTLCSFYVQALRISLGAVMLSIINGLFVLNILLINEIPDRKADARFDKRTMVVRYGVKRALIFYLIFYLASYILIIAGIYSNEFPRVSYAALGTIPLFIFSFLLGFKKDSVLLKQAIIFTIINHGVTGSLMALSFFISAR